jgi:hypothetical protein
MSASDPKRASEKSWLAAGSMAYRIEPEWKEDQSNVIAENLSAGPLEELLTKHGGTVIDRVEVMAKEDPTFAFLLGGVWRNEIAEAVWSRVLAVRDRHGWDGIPPAASDVE